MPASALTEGAALGAAATQREGPSGDPTLTLNPCGPRGKSTLVPLTCLQVSASSHLTWKFFTPVGSLVLQDILVFYPVVLVKGEGFMAHH